MGAAHRIDIELRIDSFAAARSFLDASPPERSTDRYEADIVLCAALQAGNPGAGGRERLGESEAPVAENAPWVAARGTSGRGPR